MAHDRKHLADQAQTLYDERNFSAALALFEKLCKSDPGNLNAWIMRGASNQKLGNFQAAVASLRNAVDLQPDSVHARLNLANALVTSGDLLEAVGVYQDVVKTRPANATAWVLMGKTCLQLKNLEEAEKACCTAIRLQPDNIRALMTLGDVYRARDEKEKALDCFRQVVEQAPEHGGAYAQAGMILQELGKLDAAEDAYQKAVYYNPKRQAIHFKLGVLFQAQKRLEEAEESYRRALELQPDDARALTNLGHVLLMQQKREDALSYYQRALAQESENTQMHLNVGCALRDLGREEEAVDSFRNSIQLDPGNADAHYHMGLALQTLGRLQEASDSLGEAVKLYPEFVAYLLALANLQEARANYPVALSGFRKALRIEPENGHAYYGQGSVLYAQGLLQEAVSSYRQAVRYRPNAVRNYVGLAAALMARSEHEEAAECCQQALRIRSGDTDAVALAAQIAIRKGETEKAYELLLPLLDQDVQSENVIMAFANVSKDVNRIDEAISLLEGIVDKSKNQSKESRINLHFSLGRLYDREGNYEKAFYHFEQGNQLKQVSFAAAQHMMEVDAFIALNNWYFIGSRPRASNRSERPVFIVGMPRSGTTLVEQILSSHPAVYGAGELTDIGEMAERLPVMLGSQQQFPQCLSQISTEHLDRLATAYLGRLDKLSPDAKRVTDKMLGFMYLGLIELMLPSALVIHCRRDPLDTCLSCYFQDFSASHSYSYDLHDLGVYYRGYEKIMQNWKHVLSLQTLEVQYEDMVANQERVSRQLIDFCGLEWDDSCLRFHENQRFVGTASYDQVRRPIYSSSVGRWKNYDKFIGPLREALDVFRVQQSRENQGS